MTCEADLRVELVHQLVHTTLGGTAGQISDLSPGYSGSSVYAVDVATPARQLPCIVKLIPDRGDDAAWPEDARLTNQVYGGRPTSFGPASALLRQHGIPLPRQYAALAPRSDRPYYCHVMERLPGEDVAPARARLSARSRAAFDAVIGSHLGAIHQIARPHHGWAEMQNAAARPWADTFFTALAIVLERACAHGAIARLRGWIEDTIDQYAASWRNPTRFVLSHIDGLQGMLRPDTSGWIMSGVIDIEDYSFTDPRFALAVYEAVLAHAPLESSFWAAYQQRSYLEPTYLQFRPLFQLYVLLDWLSRVPPAQQESIEALTEWIGQCCCARSAAPLACQE